jgi:hypothetical protein
MTRDAVAPVTWVLPLFCTALFLTSQVIAQPPAASASELTKMNRANQAALRRIQQPPGYLGAKERAQVNAAQQRLDRQQQGEQRLLQERQRRQVLQLNRRARMPFPVQPSYVPRSIDMQRRFRLQQQYQLNRFRGQRGPSPNRMGGGIDKP